MTSEPLPAPEDQSLEAQIRPLCRHLTAGTARLLDLLAEFSPPAARERVRVASALLYLPQLHGRSSAARSRTRSAGS